MKWGGGLNPATPGNSYTDVAYPPQTDKPADPRVTRLKKYPLASGKLGRLTSYTRHKQTVQQL